MLAKQLKSCPPLALESGLWVGIYKIAFVLYWVLYHLDLKAEREARSNEAYILNQSAAQSRVIV